MLNHIAFITTTLVFAGVLNAQSLQDAIKKTDNEQFETAAKDFRAIIAREPQNGEAYYYFGENFYQAENADSAKVMYQKGMQANPNSALNYVGLGKTLLDEGKVDQAQPNFDKALTLTQNKNATVFTEIAESFIISNKKDLAKAKNYLATAMKIDPKNPEVYITLGDAFLEENDGSKAISNYEKATDLNKNSVKAVLRIGKLYARSRNWTEALVYYKKAEAIDPNFAPSYREQGNIYYMAKQYDKAKESYKKYLDLNSANLSARLKYAYFLYETKEYANSLKELQEIERQDTSDNVLNRLLAYNYFETGDYANGLKHINKFFKRQNEKKIIVKDYEYFGKILMKSGQDSLAIEKYNAALKMDSTNTDIMSEIATSYFKTKKYDRAVEAYKRKIKTGKVNANDYFGLGRSYYFNKNYAQADSAFTKVCEMSPSFPAGYFWRGRSNSAMDPDTKQGLAKPHYEKYIELASADVDKNRKDLIEAYSYLGFYYYTAKDNAKSKEQWNKVLELDPKNEKAKKAVESIK